MRIRIAPVAFPIEFLEHPLRMRTTHFLGGSEFDDRGELHDGLGLRARYGIRKLSVWTFLFFFAALDPRV